MKADPLEELLFQAAGDFFSRLSTSAGEAFAEQVRRSFSGPQAPPPYQQEAPRGQATPALEGVGPDRFIAIVQFLDHGEPKYKYVMFDSEDKELSPEGIFAEYRRNPDMLSCLILQVWPVTQHMKYPPGVQPKDG